MKFTRRPLIINFVLALLFLTSCTTNRTAKTDAVVDKWLAANNAKDIDGLQELYTSTVMFYTYTKDVGTCMQEKKLFFDKYPDYSISITNRETDFYKGGIVKCNFIKTEYWNGKPGKPNAAYLLLEKRNGEYLITGESDQRMDTKRSYVPALGAKIENAGSMLYIVGGAAGGVLLLVALLYFIRRNKSQPAPAMAQAPMTTSLVQTDNKVPETKEMTSEAKGLAFENYVVTKFSLTYFSVLNRTSDKMASNGAFDLSSLEPDVKIQYNKDNNHCFAIECKWRSSFGKNERGISGVSWANERQINNYCEYEKEKKMPVWVAIGIGGTPDAPAKLFLISLANAKPFPFLFESYLNNYKRDPGKNFWYDVENKVLR